MKIYLDTNLCLSSVDTEEFTQDSVGYNIIKLYIPDSVVSGYDSFVAYYGAILPNSRKVGYFGMVGYDSSDDDYESGYTHYKATLESMVVSVPGKVALGFQLHMSHTGDTYVTKKNSAVVMFIVRDSVAINNDIIILDEDETPNVLKSYKNLFETAMLTYVTQANLATSVTTNSLTANNSATFNGTSEFNGESTFYDDIAVNSADIVQTNGSYTTNGNVEAGSISIGGTDIKNLVLNYYEITSNDFTINGTICTFITDTADKIRTMRYALKLNGALSGGDGTMDGYYYPSLKMVVDSYTFYVYSFTDFSDEMSFGRIIFEYHNSTLTLDLSTILIKDLSNDIEASNGELGLVRLSDQSFISSVYAATLNGMDMVSSTDAASITITANANGQVKEVEATASSHFDYDVFSSDNVVDNLNSTSTTDALSAKQGKVLNDNHATLASTVSNIQTQITTLKSVQNVIDVVADLTALGNYSTTNVETNDKIQVVSDSNHDSKSTIYNWNGSSWIYVGTFGNNTYTKTETDTLLAAKADLVDFTELQADVTTLDTRVTTQEDYKKVANAFDTFSDFTNTLYTNLYAFEDKVLVANDSNYSGASTLYKAGGNFIDFKKGDTIKSFIVMFADGKTLNGAFFPVIGDVLDNAEKYLNGTSAVTINYPFANCTDNSDITISKVSGSGDTTACNPTGGFVFSGTTEIASGYYGCVVYSFDIVSNARYTFNADTRAYVSIYNTLGDVFATDYTGLTLDVEYPILMVVERNGNDVQIPLSKSAYEYYATLESANLTRISTLETSLSTAQEQIAVLERETENLKQASLGNIMQSATYSGTAYEYTLDSDTLPNGYLLKVGGMSYKATNLWDSDNTTLEIGAIGGSGNDTTLDTRIRVNMNTKIYLTAGTYSVVFSNLEEYIWYGYTLSTDTNSAYNSNGSWQNNGSSFTLTANCYVRFAFRYTDNRTITSTSELTNLILASGENGAFIGIRDTAVTSVTNKSANLLVLSNETITASAVTFTISNGKITSSGTPSSTGWIRIKEITLNAGTYSYADLTSNTSKVYLINSSYSQITSPFTLSATTTIYLAVTGNSINNNGHLNNSMPMLIKGSTAPTQFYPYRADIVTSIPASVQALDGYGYGLSSSLTNYIDTDSKTFTKKVGRVDLGTLTWIVNQDQPNCFRATLSDIKLGDGLIPNVIVPKYTPRVQSGSSGAVANDLSISVFNNTHIVFIHDNSFNEDAQAFTTAMSGVYLYYELATPVITDISSYLDADFDLLTNLEGNGTLVFDNPYGQEAFYEIFTYEKI